MTPGSKAVGSVKATTEMTPPTIMVIADTRMSSSLLPRRGRTIPSIAAMKAMMAANGPANPGLSKPLA
jgi:hypothetical protein